MLNYSLKKEDSSKFVIGHYYDEKRDTHVIEFGDGHEETEQYTEKKYYKQNDMMEKQVRDCDQFERKLQIEKKFLLGAIFISLVLSTIGWINHISFLTAISLFANVRIIYRLGKINPLENDIEKNRYYLLHKEQFQTLEQQEEKIAITEPKLIPVLETLEGNIDINCVEDISINQLKKLRASLVTVETLESTCVKAGYQKKQ